VEIKKTWALAIVVILIVSGGTIWFLTRDGTSNGDKETYHGDASEYLLTEDEIENDWTKNKTREPNFEPTGMETGRVINFDRNGDNLTIVVIVLESIEDAENLMDDQRDTYQSYSELAEQDLGDDSFSFDWFGTTYLNIRLSNVYIQIYGDSHLNLIKGYGQQQIEEIEG